MTLKEQGKLSFFDYLLYLRDLLKKDAAVLREDNAAASGAGVETPVRMGEAIGRAAVTE